MHCLCGRRCAVLSPIGYNAVLDSGRSLAETAGVQPARLSQTPAELTTRGAPGAVKTAKLTIALRTPADACNSSAAEVLYLIWPKC